MSLANCDNGVSGARRGDITCLFDLLPGDRSRLNKGGVTIQTGEVKINDKAMTQIWFE